MIALPEIFQRTDAVVSMHKQRAERYQMSAVNGEMVTYDDIFTPKNPVFDLGYGSTGIEHYRYYCGWAYVAIKAISTRVASLAWKAAEITEAAANPERFMSGWMEKVPQHFLSKLHDDQTLEPIMSHPVLDLVDQPNFEQRSWEFLYFSVANLQISGVAYWILGQGQDGEPNLFAVPSPCIRLDRKKGVYRYTPKGMAEGIPIDPEYVGKTNLPDPSDHTGSHGPLQACLPAVKTDDYIQRSQWMAYERGIHPNLIVGTSKDPNTKQRTQLHPAQRRQLIRAIREVWSGTTNLGDPVILDGLIDSVHKLHSSPQEMDWPKSGEIVKDRIFQAFHVNPYIVGQITNVNRAQASVAESVFNSQVVNPIASLFSGTMTSLLGPRYEQPKRLIVYLEEAKAVDREQRLKEYTAMRRTGDVTGDEMRTAIAGLPPMAEQEDAFKDVDIDKITALQAQVANGQIPAENAISLLVDVLGWDEKVARSVIGEGNTAPKPQPPPQFLGRPDDAEDNDEEDEDEEDNNDDDDEKSFKSGTPKDRYIKASIERFAKSERRLGQSLAEFFRRYYDGVDRQTGGCRVDAESE